MSAPDCHSNERSVWADLWPLDPGITFLNHGSFGSCPTWVLEQQRALQDRLEREPLRFIVEDIEELLDRARRELGGFLGADEQGLVFVTNATEGVNAVVRSLDLKPGDELLTNSHEYNACNNALRYVAERAGARVVCAELPFPVSSANEVAERILERLSAKTRLVLLSHVTSPTALVMPIERIVVECNRLGVETLIDGAHAPGMVPIELGRLGATYYTGNCHKWLCSPKGAGFLWVREDRRRAVRPTVISHGANSPRTDRSRLWQEFDYCGTRDFTPWLCVPLGIRYVESLHPRGWAGIMERNRELALRGQAVLCRVLGIEVPAPADMIGSMASAPIPARPTGAITPVSKYHDGLQDQLLARHGVQAPIFVLGEPPNRQRIARVSCQLYNSSVDAVRYADALAAELAAERRAAAAAAVDPACSRTPAELAMRGNRSDRLA